MKGRAACPQAAAGAVETPRRTDFRGRTCCNPAAGGRPDHTRRGERGFASVIVLILIFVMIALLLGNNRALHLLKRDLQRIEERQALRASRPGPPVLGGETAPLRAVADLEGEREGQGAAPVRPAPDR